MIYLDNAATTNPKPPSFAQEAMQAAEKWCINAGRGSYQAAQQAIQLMDQCRQRLLSLVHIQQGYTIGFSPSATISLNEIIFGIEADAYTHIYVSPFEHNAVMRPIVARCKQSRSTWQMLPWNRETWTLDVQACNSAFVQNKPDYLFIPFVSNATGMVVDVANLVKLAHAHGAKVIVDCAQAMGAIEANYQAIDADAYVFAGHKTLYGPFGIAGMIRKSDFHLQPLYFGGTGTDSLNFDMEEGAEPGSPNIMAIAQLSSSIRWIEQIGVSTIETHERMLGSQLIAMMSEIPKVHVFAPPQSEQCSGIVAFVVEGYQSHDVGEVLEEEYGICVRTGYQCAPLVHDWLVSKPYGGIVRASIGYFNTISELYTLCEALRTL